MNETSKKNRIIKLLTLKKKKMQKFSEQELIDLIGEIDLIREESVQDRRFLDAENSKQKLIQLREILEKKKKKNLKKMQKNENQKLDSDFQQEMENF